MYGLSGPRDQLSYDMVFPMPRLLDPAQFCFGQDRQPGLLLLQTSGGLRAAVCVQGARLLQLIVPDRNGQPRDVVLGYDSLAGVQDGLASLGAFVGRYANRIGQARFALDGTTWQVPANDGAHCLHGGPGGSRHQMFELLSLSTHQVTLGWVFRETQDGFPGDVTLTLRYTLSDPGTLAITWEAQVSGRATVLNFTPHPYFNLEGDGLGDPGQTHLQVAASHVLRIDASRVPTGHIDPVEGGPLDFRQGQRLADAAQALGTGVDHCLVLDVAPAPGLRQAARAQAPGSGIAMEVWCDAPALQVYSGHGIDGSLPRCLGKEGRVYGPAAGFCLEPQQFPDAPNHPHFPSTRVEAGAVSRGTVEYRFHP